MFWAGYIEADYQRNKKHLQESIWVALAKYGHELTVIDVTIEM
jgi:hypothetical protein